MIKVSLVQFSPVLGNKEKNIEKMNKFLNTEQDLVVFGELSLTGYMCRDALFTLAEHIEDTSVKRLSALSTEFGTHIIFGMPEMANKRIYNSAVLVCPDNKTHVYRKIHLANFGPFEEKLYFAEGRDINIFNTKLGKIGILICFDLFFPELAKIYTLRDADMIICISASPSTTKYFFETVIPARAIENTVFVLYSNLVGTQQNLVFWGGNMVVDPRGNIIAKGEYYKECAVNTTIDISEINVARQFRPTVKDTKFEILKKMLPEVEVPKSSIGTN